MISPREEARLLDPENSGMRLFLTLGRAVPGAGAQGDSGEAMIQHIRELEFEERQEVLGVIKVTEEAVIELIVEHGGMAPGGYTE